MAKVIKPVDMTDAKLIYCNIPEPDTANGEPAVYAPGTTYAAGDRCTVVATHKIYESLVGANIGNYPPDDILATVPKWAEVSYTNKWAAFDPYVNTQAYQSTTLSYKLDAQRTSAVALFNIEAGSVELVLRGSDTTVLASEVFTMYDDTCTDWFDYFFSEIEYKDRVFWEYPVNFGATLEITLTSTGGTSKVGVIRHGLIKEIGTAAQEIETGIVDFSIKEEDSYGRVYLKQGAYRDLIDVSLYIPNTSTSNIAKFLKSLRAIPCIWIMDNEELISNSMDALTVYGFFKDFGVVIKTKHPNSLDECSLSLEGLI